MLCHGVRITCNVGDHHARQATRMKATQYISRESPWLRQPSCSTDFMDPKCFKDLVSKNANPCNSCMFKVAHRYHMGSTCLMSMSYCGKTDHTGCSTAPALDELPGSLTVVFLRPATVVGLGSQRAQAPPTSTIASRLTIPRNH